MSNITIYDITKTINGKLVPKKYSITIEKYIKENAQLCPKDITSIRNFIIDKKLYHQTVGCGELRKLSCLLSCDTIRGEKSIELENQDTINIIVEANIPYALIILKVPITEAYQSNTATIETRRNIKDNHILPAQKIVGKIDKWH